MRLFFLAQRIEARTGHPRHWAAGSGVTGTYLCFTCTTGEADDTLHLRYDEEMTGYSWDASLYPACPKPEPAAEIPEENAETDIPASAGDTQPPDDAQEAEPSAEKEEKTEAKSLRRS